MKKTILALIIIASSALHAEIVELPIISSPAILREGTQRTLTKDQIAELLPWAKNSKVTLKDALESLQGLATADKIYRLKLSIEQTVQDSGAGSKEMFMRYALNRSLVISDILNKEMDDLKVGTADVKLRVLTQSIEMALRYYDIDMNVLSKKSDSPYKDFGVEYFYFLTDLNKSIFDASAQYTIQRTALEFLQWDLYRDLNNKNFASQILKINTGLKNFPATKVTDTQAINLIRQMKKVGESLGFKRPVIVEKIEESLEIEMPLAMNDTMKALDDTSFIITNCSNAASSYISAKSTVRVIDPTPVKLAYASDPRIERIMVKTLTQRGATGSRFQTPVGCIGYVVLDQFEKVK